MITSVSNAKIKNVMQLNQKAKARREQGLFVAEGRKMFLEAPENWVFQVFVSETFSQDGELMAQVEKYPYEIVKDSVFRQMCDTKTPQGILTVLKLPSWSEEEVLAEKILWSWFWRIFRIREMREPFLGPVRVPA